MQEDFIDINDFAGEAPADQAAEVEKLEDAPAEENNNTDSSEAAPESNAPRRVIGVITGKEIEEGAQELFELGQKLRRALPLLCDESEARDQAQACREQAQ